MIQIMCLNNDSNRKNDTKRMNDIDFTRIMYDLYEEKNKWLQIVLSTGLSKVNPLTGKIVVVNRG